MLFRMVPRFRRALPSLIALASFLGAGWGDARGLDPCPHHDRLPGQAGGHAAGAAAPSEHAAMAGMDHGHGGGHGARSVDPAGPDRDSGNGHDGHGPCTCVGRCDVGGSVAVPTVSAPIAALPHPQPTAEPAPHVAREAHGPATGWSPYLPLAPPVPVRRRSSGPRAPSRAARPAPPPIARIGG